MLFGCGSPKAGTSAKSAPAVRAGEQPLGSNAYYEAERWDRFARSDSITSAWAVVWGAIADVKLFVWILGLIVIVGGLTYGVITWDALAEVGSVTSILGLIVSGLVLASVETIRRRYLIRARLPDMIEQLSEHASEIVSLVADHPETRHAINVEMAECVGVLKNLEKKIPRDFSGSVRAVRKQVERCQGSNHEESDVRTIYAELQKLVSGLRNYYRDLRWER